MDLFNRSELRRLAELQGDVSVSIYMPTQQYESDWSQNTTRLKNLLREARNQLRNQDHREEQIDDILAEARQLLDRPGFWRHLSDGLALFMTPGNTELYRLPLTFNEVAIVGNRFHLKPLFPLIAANNRFYLLSLNKSDVRLYQGTHQSISEVESTDIPKSIVDAFEQRDADEASPQVDVQARETRENGEQGHNTERTGEEDSPEDALERFFQEISSDVDQHLNDETVPLVLAGVKDYLSLYRSVNDFPHLLEEDIVTENLGSIGAQDLHNKAWAIVEPVFLESQNEEMERFEQLYYQQEDMASDDFHEIVPGCAYSRVDTLFVPVGEYRWGRFDPETNTVEVHESKQPGDGDLLNYAAVTAYLNGATIHALHPENMPGGRSIAATFRYQANVSAQESG